MNRACVFRRLVAAVDSVYRSCPFRLHDERKDVAVTVVLWVSGAEEPRELDVWGSFEASNDLCNWADTGAEAFQCSLGVTTSVLNVGLAAKYYRFVLGNYSADEGDDVFVSATIDGASTVAGSTAVGGPQSKGCGCHG